MGDARPMPWVETIKADFGITVSHDLLVDFDGFQAVVDAVGGIRLDFPTPVRDDDNGHDNSGLLVTTPAAGCWTATRPWPAVAPPWPATTRADGTGPPGALRPWDPRPC